MYSLGRAFPQEVVSNLSHVSIQRKYLERGGKVWKVFLQTSFPIQTTAVGFPFAWDTTWLWLVSFNWYHLSAAKPLCSCVQLKQVQSETKVFVHQENPSLTFFFYFLLLWQCLIELPQLKHPYSPAIVDHSQCHIPISANVPVNPTRLSIKGAACRIHVYVLTNCKDFLLVVGTRNVSDFKVKVRTSDPAAVQG